MNLFEASNKTVKLYGLLFAGLILALISIITTLFGLSDISDTLLNNAVFLIAFSVGLTIIYAVTE